MNIFCEELALEKSEDTNAVGTAKKKTIEPNGVFYHVIQQMDNRSGLFSADAARHRDALLKSQCITLGIKPLINVVLPTHTHDVFLTDDVKKISMLFANVNRGTPVFIRKERKSKGKRDVEKVFSKSIGYVAIKTRAQFFILFKYLYDNPSYLKDSGDFVPYSCFDAWEKGYFKPYNTKIWKQLFGMEVDEILKKCRTMDKTQFQKEAYKLFKDSEEVSNSLFKKDPNKDWLI